MKTISAAITMTALGAALALSACSKEHSEASTDKAPTAAAADKQASPEPATKPADGVAAELVQKLMEPYEDCRALLAADKAEGVGACAKALSTAAESGQQTAGAKGKEQLSAVATTAKALADTEADDIETVRLAFGRVSEAMVSLLGAAPAAAKSYHVFECPMAKGYKRWAQSEAKLANPYMGSKMLECGKEVHDHHQGMAGGDHGDMHN